MAITGVVHLLKRWFMLPGGRLLVLVLLCSSIVPCAWSQQPQPLHVVPVDGRTMTMDELGNTYVIRTDNTLIRYNNQGDSTGFYRSALNGDIGFVDATNPLRILLCYPAFAKVLLLDRMLTEKTVIDLHRRQIMQAPAVATASDGRLWVYDPFNAKLLKLDESGEVVRSSNDLRQQLNFVPNPTFMLERDRKVYVCDTLHGILIFDQFANYISSLPVRNVAQLQAFDQQLVYRQGHELHSYHLKTFSEQEIELPGGQEGILSAVISQNVLAILYQDRLAIYQWPLR